MAAAAAAAPVPYTFKVLTTPVTREKRGREIDVMYSTNHEFTPLSPRLALGVDVLQKFSVLVLQMNVNEESGEPDAPVKIQNVGTEAALDAVLCCASDMKWRRPEWSRTVFDMCTEAIKLADFLGASDPVFKALDNGIGRYYANAGEALGYPNPTYDYMDVTDLGLLDKLNKKMPFTWALFCSFAYDNTPDLVLRVAELNLSCETVSRLWYIRESKLKGSLVTGRMMPKIAHESGFLLYKRCEYLDTPDVPCSAWDYHCVCALDVETKSCNIDLPEQLRGPMKLVNDSANGYSTFHFFTPMVSQRANPVNTFGVVTSISVAEGYIYSTSEWHEVVDPPVYSPDGVHMKFEADNLGDLETPPLYFRFKITGHVFRNGRLL